MLILFPIQFLTPLAHTVLRLCVGLIFVNFGIRNIVHHRVSRGFTYYTYVGIGLGEIVIGGFFIVGAYTQLAALCAVLFSGLQIIKGRHTGSPDSLHRMFFILLFFASLSLFITGAGAFGFDLPI